MNITKGMLKELIRATLSESPDLDSYRSYDNYKTKEKNKNNPPTEKLDMDVVKDAFVDVITTVLGVIGVLDPTMISDVASATVYAAAGRYEEAMLTIALSAGGLGSGALAVKAGVPIAKVAKVARNTRVLTFMNQMYDTKSVKATQALTKYIEDHQYDDTLISSEQIRQVEKSRSAAELQAIPVIDAYKTA